MLKKELIRLNDKYKDMKKNEHSMYFNCNKKICISLMITMPFIVFFFFVFFMFIKEVYIPIFVESGHSLFKIYSVYFISAFFSFFILLNFLYIPYYCFYHSCKLKNFSKKEYKNYKDFILKLSDTKKNAHNLYNTLKENEIKQLQ